AAGPRVVSGTCGAHRARSPQALPTPRPRRRPRRRAWGLRRAGCSHAAGLALAAARAAGMALALRPLVLGLELRQLGPLRGGQDRLDLGLHRLALALGDRLANVDLVAQRLDLGGVDPVLLVLGDELLLEVADRLALGLHRRLM